MRPSSRSRYAEQISVGIWWWGKPNRLLTASLIWLQVSPSLAYLLQWWLSCQKKLFHTVQRFSQGSIWCCANQQGGCKSPQVESEWNDIGWYHQAREPQFNKSPNNYWSLIGEANMIVFIFSKRTHALFKKMIAAGRVKKSSNKKCKMQNRKITWRLPSKIAFNRHLGTSGNIIQRSVHR